MQFYIFQMYEKNDFHFLEVLNVTQEDKGEFTCTITNSKGNVSHSIDLDVYSKFHFSYSLNIALGTK